MSVCLAEWRETSLSGEWRERQVCLGNGERTSVSLAEWREMSLKPGAVSEDKFTPGDLSRVVLYS